MTTKIVTDDDRVFCAGCWEDAYGDELSVQPVGSEIFATLPHTDTQPCSVCHYEYQEIDQ